jgi:hypothetical protein
VTQGQLKTVKGKHPSKNEYGDQYPAEDMSWNDALDFIKELSA